VPRFRFNEVRLWQEAFGGGGKALPATLGVGGVNIFSTLGICKRLRIINKSVIRYM